MSVFKNIKILKLFSLILIFQWHLIFFRIAVYHYLLEKMISFAPFLKMLTSKYVHLKIKTKLIEELCSPSCDLLIRLRTHRYLKYWKRISVSLGRKESITNDPAPFLGQPWPQKEKKTCLVHKGSWETAATFNMYKQFPQWQFKKYILFNTYLIVIHTQIKQHGNTCHMYLRNLWTILFNWWATLWFKRERRSYIILQILYYK